MNPPNLVIVSCHDLGDYLSVYGTPVDTPSFERMAADGVVFERHFSTGTVCSPARGSITTGCYPHTHGLMGLVHRGWELGVEKCPHIAARLAAAGYEAHLFGFQHEHWDAKRLGYGEVHKAESNHADHVAPMFCEWLKSRGGDGRPFYAAVGFSEVHRMGLQPSHFRREGYVYADPAEVEVRPYLADIPEVRADLAEFYGALNTADRMMGTVMDALESAGEAENTLLVFTTDHGASFMHSKATLYDGGTKVAFLARLPGVVPGGTRVEALTSHVDILPTVFDLMGLEAPGGIEGTSMAGLAKGEAAPERDYVFAERNYTNYYDPGRMARSKRWKYVRKGLRTNIFDFIIPEIELCPSGFRQNRTVFEFYPAERTTERLYNLDADPGEMRDLSGDPSHSEVLDGMRAALAAHLEGTKDPFKDLRNDILMSEGAYGRVRDGLGW